MPTFNIPSHTIQSGVTEYGPVVVNQNWTKAQVALNMANLTPPVWAEIVCSFDNWATRKTIMRLDIVAPAADGVARFAVGYPDGIASAQLKLTIDSPASFATTGGSVTVT